MKQLDAPKGTTWLCGACGATGSNRSTLRGCATIAGCFLHALLVEERDLVRDEKTGRVIDATAAPYAVTR